ncbi:MAG: glycoside hydrolase, partial [Xanthomonadales bacterium]|nr:glycoside hydrolase [Xanthomonadales bacterium]
MAQDTAAGAMRVVLCWHMHQPDYRLQGRLLRPWTWLHAIKDYSDMAAHLEEIPGARAVVNFSPVLIRQLQDLPERIRALLASREPSGDAILDALAGCRAQGPQRQDLVRALLRVNEQHMKPRLPAYAHLFESARQALEAGSPLSDSDLGDLLVTYVLTWTGESLRSAPLPRRLLAREHNYSDDDRAELLAWLGDTIAGLLSRYRALADSG